MLHMVQVTQIHKGKNPPRLHYLAEWAERRGLKQVDIIRETGADKGTVSRWFAGKMPETPYLFKLIGALELDDEPNAFFRHPDDDWFKKMFAGRRQQEIDDAKTLVEINLRKSGGTGTDG